MNQNQCQSLLYILPWLSSSNKWAEVYDTLFTNKMNN